MKVVKSLALVVAIGSIVACGHEEKPATPPPTAPVALRPASPGKTNSTIYVSEEMKKQCALGTIESTKEAPKFQFDETDITADDRDVLAQVARCMTTGPLKGHTVKLVGRADKRGSSEYNMALGAKRADAVKSYLGNLGVGAAQLTETSRGELDATGATEDGFKKDRRVDIDFL